MPAQKLRCGKGVLVTGHYVIAKGEKGKATHMGKTLPYHNVDRKDEGDMWRINELVLENFSLIYAGLEKEKIHLNLRETDREINVLIGKMGSGKTTILGHLQPFASFGTLDNRNQNAQIIPERDGKKIIEFSCGSTIYRIEHRFLWNKHTESHNLKSYIQINGEEQNDNGNSGSFKEIVKREFGIDQSFLRLLRLGPNVANLIDLKSTDRKTFVASLRQDADFYLVFHKKLSEGLRGINSNISVLSNKLLYLDSTAEDTMRTELSMILEQIRDSKELIEDYKTDLFQRTGQNTTLLQGQTIEELKTGRYQEQADRRWELCKIVEELGQEIGAAIGPDSLTTVATDIGTTQERIRQLDTLLLSQEEEVKQLTSEHIKLTDMQQMAKDQSQIEELKDLHAEVQAKWNRYNDRLEHFTCPHSSQAISTLIDDLQLLKDRIRQASEYAAESLQFVYHSDGTIGTWTNKKINMLIGKRVNLQKKINNLTFSGQYEIDQPLFRAPLCPTIDCPYYQSHPATIQQKRTEVEKQQQNPMVVLTNQFKAIEAEIDRYTEYPQLYQLLQSIRGAWNNAISILEPLGVLHTKQLYQVLTDFSYRSNWYDQVKLTQILETCKMREEFYQLTENLHKMEVELRSMENLDQQDLPKKIQENRDQYQLVIQSLRDEEAEKGILQEKLDRLEFRYKAIQRMEENKQNYQRSKEELRGVQKELEEWDRAIESVEDNVQVMQQDHVQITSLERDLQKLVTESETLRSTLKDIVYTKKEFGQALEEKEKQKWILRAVSPKEGIPLVMIQVFLNQCREIVNELISDVFSDDLEILEFNLAEDQNEFKIPYSINGNRVDDIEYASQGERAIISIALSFAIVQQIILSAELCQAEIPYNIMLLDEVDGALHKRDREKFTSLLFKQKQEIRAIQLFFITHGTGFENNPVNVIMTTEEQIDTSAGSTIMRLY